MHLAILWLDNGKTVTLHPTVAQLHAQYTAIYFITSHLHEEGRGESRGEVDVFTLKRHLGQQAFSNPLLS